MPLSLSIPFVLAVALVILIVNSGQPIEAGRDWMWVIGFLFGVIFSAEAQGRQFASFQSRVPRRPWQVFLSMLLAWPFYFPAFMHMRFRVRRGLAKPIAHTTLKQTEDF